MNFFVHLHCTLPHTSFCTLPSPQTCRCYPLLATALQLRIINSVPVAKTWRMLIVCGAQEREKTKLKYFHGSALD